MTRYRSVFSLDEHRWPSGLARAAAVFRTPPEEATARTEIAFEAGVDDLDYFRAAGVELASGRRVVLLWHERAPVPGLVLEVDMADDPEAARAEVAAALGFVPADVVWQPEPDPPAG